MILVVAGHSLLLGSANFEIDGSVSWLVEGNSCSRLAMIPGIIHRRPRSCTGYDNGFEILVHHMRKRRRQVFHPL